VILNTHHTHPWNLSPKEAILLQQELRQQVKVEVFNSDLRFVGGIDVGFRDEKARAAVAILSFPEMQLVEQVTAESAIPFPYVPGLLSFREAPVILAAMEQLPFLPDVFMLDGQGIAHPRRFGIASHLGVLLDMPTIGCAKSLLVGRWDGLAETAGSLAELMDGEEKIGMAVRTKDKCKPIIVSIGHRMDIDSAVRLVLACGRGYRLPEPTRWAHRIASVL